MRAKVTKIMFLMSLLLLLLGENRASLMAGGPGTVPEPPAKMVQSPSWMVASGGIVAEPPIKPTMSIVA
jgi:hypothetical protein